MDNENLNNKIREEIAEYIGNYIENSKQNIENVLMSDNPNSISKLQVELAVVSARVNWLHGQVKNFIMKDFLVQKFSGIKSLSDPSATAKAEIQAEVVFLISRRDLDRLISALKNYSIVASSRLNVLSNEFKQSGKM